MTITIVFCIPGRQFSNNFLTSWTNLLAWCFKNDIDAILSNSYSSNVFFVRSMCLGGNNLKGVDQKPFQGQVDYDYIMWIDSDQVFYPNDLIKLLNWKKDIVCGMYMMHDNINYAVVPHMNKNDILKKGSYTFLNRAKVKEWKESRPNSIHKVDYCGMGFMLVKKGVLEKFEFPWFRSTETILEDKERNIVIHDTNSEDYYFCCEARRLGFDVWVDPEVVVGHEKMFTI